MDKKIEKMLKDIYMSPKPEREEEFIKYIGTGTVIHQKPVVMNHCEFVMGQLPYIQKWVWIFTAGIFLFMILVCLRAPEVSPFAMTALLAAGILVETKRSGRCKMDELEYAARFSLRSVMLARVFLIGMVDSVVLIAAGLILSRTLSYSSVQVFLYMNVPFLSSAWMGAFYERKQRMDRGWGSIAICISASLAFVFLPIICSWIYEERWMLYWVIAFFILCIGFADNMRKLLNGMEEPAWN